MIARATSGGRFDRLRPLLEKWIRQQIGETEYPRNHETIRTYHEVDNWVLDHASGHRISWAELDKKFDEMITARARAYALGINKKEGIN